MEYDMELHANGKQYGIAFERNGKLFQNDDIDYNIYGFYINGEKVGEFGHTYPIKATFNINKYLPLIEKMVHNEGAIWGWEKANAINESKRTINVHIIRHIYAKIAILQRLIHTTRFFLRGGVLNRLSNSC